MNDSLLHRRCFPVLLVGLIAGLVVGCGGDRNGVIDAPPVSENPYQITTEQQGLMDQSMSASAKISEEDAY